MHDSHHSSMSPSSKHDEHNEQSQHSNRTPHAATPAKGKPTPKRKAAQASQLRPLVPQDRRASAKAARMRARAQDNREYEAMRSGDLAHMPKAEQLPVRVYIRDYVDARYNLGEFFIPVAFAVMAISLLTVRLLPPIAANLLMLAMWVYLLAAGIDVAIMWRKLKRQLIERFGEAAVGKGTHAASYAWARAIQLRRWRIPKPRFAHRGHFPAVHE